jgi:hypothetical protein
MRKVLEQGTTLFYVSHDLPTVEATCTRGIWLREGAIVEDASLPTVLSSYRHFIEESAEVTPTHDGLVRVNTVDVIGPTGNGAITGQALKIQLVLDSLIARPTNLYLGISEGSASPIFTLRHEANLSPGETLVQCRIQGLPLPKGEYFLWGSVADRTRTLLGWHPLTRFRVSGPALDESPPGIVRLAPLHISADWETARQQPDTVLSGSTRQEQGSHRDPTV